MTQYMYNPSKKVTELLSEYLEFDPEQLQLGIWSGNLSLSNVNLRQEAIYPLVNGFLNKPSASDQRHYKKPPLNVKLVSGTIGSLNMTIPWKRLVWGQGDVKVEARNIVIVLALESQDETQAREKVKQDSGTLYPLPEERDSEDSPQGEASKLPSPPISREKKQKRLREAERRHLQDRSLAAWLEAVNRKDDQAKAKAAVEEHSPIKKDGHIEKWLRGATSDFFWRFYSGLEMTIENLKIIIVQDGVEVGVIAPSVEVSAGDREQRPSMAKPSDETASQMSSDNMTQTPAEGMVYEGEYEDGEHVDKAIKHTGLSIYVRRASSDVQPAEGPDRFLEDVSTKEYILRPLDVNFSFSLFYPYPPERRRKIALEKRAKAAKADGSVTGGEGSSTASSKPRRGKRDKKQSPTGEASTVVTDLSSSLSSVQRGSGHYKRTSTPVSFADFAPPLPAHARRTNSASSGGLLSDSRRRRQSMVGSLRSSMAPNRPPHGRSGHTRRNATTSLPLARPDDIHSVFAAAAVDNVSLTPRFDSRLKVGAVQFVCSTRHYELLNAFLAAGARMRNGRPTKAIRSVLDQVQTLRRSLMVEAPAMSDHEGNSLNSFESPDQVEGRNRRSLQLSLELPGARNERSEVVRSWWNYTLGVIVWELRQRKRLRKNFQDTYLSFSWDRQRFKRKEYVNLYIAVHLQSRESVERWVSGLSFSQAPEEDLLALEDVLPIEQILLYRSIARAIHVRGGTEMPESIGGLRGGRDSPPPTPHHKADDRPAAKTAGVPLDDNALDDGPTYLTSIETRCESARRRRDAKDGEVLAAYEHKVPWSKVGGMGMQSMDADDASFGFGADKTVRTFMTSKSGATSSMTDAARQSGKASADEATLFSFAVTMDKLEFMVVEEEFYFDGVDDPRQESRFGGNSVGSLGDMDMSEVSVLTDDHKYFENGRNAGASDDFEERAAEPIMASTDYLLFKMPEKVLARVIVSPVVGNLLGRSGRSRNINLTVGHVDMTGENGRKLLSVGTHSQGAPVSEVNLTRDSTLNEQVPGGGRDQIQRNAVSISLVIQQGSNVLQCDTSKVKSCLDLHTLSKLFAFSNTSARYPKQLLPRSAREDVRLYVLKQNATVAMSTLNASIRVHGYEIFLPYHTEEQDTTKDDDDDVSFSYGYESVSGSDSDGPGVLLKTDIIEIYSGAAVESLGADMDDPQGGSTQLSGSLSSFAEAGESNAKTRRLRMLDVGEITESRDSIFSHHWVIATSGVDCLTNASQSEEENDFDSLSLFESPVDVELLWTFNDNSVLDTNRALREFIAEISPVHVLLSEARVNQLSLVVPPADSLSARPSFASSKNDVLPPRLELLSRFLLYSIELSIGRTRVSFVTDGTPLPSNILMKEAEMEDSVTDFLSVVLSFDLSYPHEEALSSAMQICIDRLTGIGLPLEESWEATNTALLNFLEDVAEMRQMQSGGQPQTSPGIRESMPTDLVHATLQRSVGRTIALFSPQLANTAPDTEYSNAGVVVDFPDGATMSFVQLFYDYHLNGSVPSFFVTNYAGVHILRVIPPENSVAGDDNGLDGLSDNAEVYAPEERYQEESFISSLQAGVGFGVFELDKGCSFGKGGLPLSILGTDVDANDEERRERERVNDVEVGEVEILFSQQLVADAVERVVGVLDSLVRFGSSGKQKGSKKASEKGPTLDTSLLVVGASVSFLLASDELFPFSRLTLTDAVVRTNANPLMSGLPAEPQVRVSAQSMSILNLTPDGELYPRVATMLPSARTVPFRVRYYSSAAGSELQIELHGFRVFVLRQFVNECLQFLLSGDFGIGLFMTKLRETGLLGEKTGPKLRFDVSVFDSSVILPRCTSSSDMIALEVDKGRIFSGAPTASFAMPTESTPLQVFEKAARRTMERIDDDFVFHDCVDSLNDAADPGESDSESPAVSRTIVRLDGFRVYTSLSGAAVSRDGESPSFRFFYSVDGRASAGKPVYRRHGAVNRLATEEEEGASSMDMEKTLRCWQEISANVLALEIFVDYAPYLRLLIADPRDSIPKPFGLDFSQSQFCLLLSVWYSNMKEPPVLFPYQRAPVMATEVDLPEYGTEEFKAVLKDISQVWSETGIVVSQLSIRCCDDVVDRLRGEVPGMQLTFKDAVVHVTSDAHGVMRIGTGSSEISFVDESKIVQKVILAGAASFGDTAVPRRSPSWADLQFGLDSSLQTLSNAKLPLTFQLSVFMVRGWSIYQMGVDQGRVAMTDFSSVSKLLAFISTYFNDPSYGNPALDVLPERVDDATTVDEEDEPREEPLVTEKDFRLWLTKPRLAIPCDRLDTAAPGLRLTTDAGFWYRYTTLGDYGTQECASCDLNLLYDDKCISTDQLSNALGKPLITGLSFGLRIDFNGVHNHSDISLRVPYTDSDACSFTSPRVCVAPTILVPPTICSPLNEPHRFLGPKVCELTCIIEILPVASTALMQLFSSQEEEQPGDDEAGHDDDDDDEVASGNDSTDFEDAVRSYTNPSALDMDVIGEEEAFSQGSAEDNATLSFVASLGDMRLFALDPVLGPHLPVAVVSIASLSITASRFAGVDDDVDVVLGEAPPEDLQLVVEGHVWADYFKLGLTRSWEPLLEPYQFMALYEKSRFRGAGVTLNSDSSFHVNVSGALLLILDEVIGSFEKLVRETFGMQTSSESNDEPTTVKRAPVSKKGLVLESYTEETGARVLHKAPRLLESGDRVAFSLRNDTGQKLRFYRANDVLDDGLSKPVVVTYVGHLQSTELSFEPSISMVNNMAVADVPYPGLPNSSHQVQQRQNGHKPAVDVQLPGFRWLQGIKVDTFGRRFECIEPRSEELSQKTSQDWRLDNVMKLLVEVGLENGGRQVVVRSLFSVVNKTAHDIYLAVHPDPTFVPGAQGSAGNECADAVIEPEEQYQVPTLLMESALRQSGSHLGSVWAKPRADSSNSTVLHSFIDQDKGDASSLNVSFCSRPVQLAKVVNESALLFEASRSKDVTPDEAKSGVQVSCPVVHKEGERLAPFCYAVEVGRSPLVKARDGTDKELEKQRESVHGPVAYTLSFYPPFMIVNLLPEKGRFELMHAVRRTVLWFGDLEPGQQIAVHSVGLDAPLLLFLNLGFCRTPVGEGALVHHGVDPPAGTRENMSGLKSIGKAGKAVTKQLGKTLTAIGDSPDRRGHQKVFRAQNPQPTGRKKRRRTLRSGGKTDLGMESDMFGREQVDGKVHRIDTTTFFSNDVVAETTVVDTIGQRLNLQIENVRGGGGQRRISLYCPFWIVNTTEHALRYRQEKTKSFVSGTVLSPTKDGSIPLSGGRAGAKYAIPSSPREKPARSHPPLNEETIFSGTPGALATSPGRSELPPEELAELIDRNLPLTKLAKLGFMFNFHEGLVTIGNQKLCVQLGDGTEKTRYVSDWSRGFSLESVGFSQPVGMHCKDGRALELTAVVTLAPGVLSGYTKIVRFLPRYVVVNTLPTPVRVWQDSSVFRPVTDQGTIQKERKWRVRHDRQRESRKVNQYEALWGREAVLDERKVDGIAARTTANQNALYVTTIGSAELVPFNLPDSRGERQLRIGLGGPWNLSASFSAEIPGEHTLKVTRAVDLRLLRYVATRASPQYEVRLPPPGESTFTGELGVWFETEWGSDRSLIVKGVKKNSFSFNQTDIHTGDELLRIGGVPVARMTFSEAMNMLRTRLTEVSARGPVDTRRTKRRASLAMMFPRSNNPAPQEPEPIHGTEPLVLTFRTVEERLRRVRLNAAKSNAVKSDRRRDSDASDAFDAGSPSTGTLGAVDQQPLDYITAELKTLHHSMFLILRQDDNIPYQIQNRTINSTIYYRQKGCNAHPWQMLKPGQSDSYSWEEPMKPKRLTVRAAVDSSFVDSAEDAQAADNILESAVENLAERGTDIERRSQRFARIGLFRNVDDEEEAVFSQSINIRLEEIGLREFLPHPDTAHGKSMKLLQLEVDVSGATRVLVVNDVSGEGDDEQMVRHLSDLERKCTSERLRKEDLLTLKSRVAPGSRTEMDDDATEAIMNTTKYLMEDFSDETTIYAQPQMAVEVLEAVGLSPDSLTGYCNPFVEIDVKSPSTARRSLFQKKDTRRTYFVRKTVNPTWNSQSFVFDVPEEAASVTRGHSVQIRVRNFRSVGRHSVLGSTKVDFHSVRNQRALIGWFPLSSRGGGQDLESPLTHWGKGSVKLKIQWIYTLPALIDYFLLLSETRLVNLYESLAGMTQQLQNKMEADTKKRERSDGFKAVRINDLLSRSKKVSKAKHHPEMKVARVLEHREGLQSQGQSSAVLRSSEGKRKLTGKTHGAQTSVSTSLTDPARNAVRRIRALSLHPLKLSRFGNPKSFPESEGNEDNGVPVEDGSEHYSEASTVSRASGPSSELAILKPPAKYLDAALSSLARVRKRLGSTSSHQEGNLVSKSSHSASYEVAFKSESERLVNLKLQLPQSAPVAMSAQAQAYAAKFLSSRTMFERASKRALRAVLNPGGWLTIRPMTVLNLPDTYTGMFVKLRYGSEILVSETVDAKVNPTWQKPNELADGRPQRPSEAGHGSEAQRDLHIHVAPQKTSGSIQLSIIGERRSKQLLTKADLGVLHLPLGSTIAACIDCTEASKDSDPVEPTASPPMYVRWFPLMSPKDAVPVEGDRGLSLRPPECEKTSDDLFHEYFAPCIQLAIVWWPDVDEEDAANELSEENLVPDGERVDRTGTQSQSRLPGVGSTPMVNSYFNADIGRVSAALIDSQRATELISFAALDVDVRYWVTNAKTRIGVSVGWLQIDHQEDNPREPVILAPTPTEKFVPVIQVLAVKDNLRSETDVLSFHFIDISIAEFDVTIEESFLSELFDFISAVKSRRGLKTRTAESASGSDPYGTDEAPSALSDPNETSDEPSLLSLLSGDSGPDRENKVYIEQLFLGVIKVNLSYLKGKKQARETTTNQGASAQTARAVGERLIAYTTTLHDKSDVFIGWSQQTYDEDRWAESRGKGTQHTFGLVASLFPTVSDAPIRLQGKALDHVFESPSEIFQSIKKFYVNETLRQLYKIIGSLDFAGNPTMILSSFVSGVRDLFVVPSVAFLSTPTDAALVGLGVAKGTLSLVSHSASGFFGFMAKVSAGAGQFVATLSFDSDFRNWHRDKVVTEVTNLNREWKRRGVQSVGSMASKPFLDIILGFTTGVSGVVLSPYHGYRRGGNAGLIKGVAIGAVGVLAKPTVGILDSLTHMASSIHDIAKSVNVLDKRYQPALKLRLPYTFGIMSILAPFDPAFARAVFLLKLFPVKKSRRTSLENIPETPIHVEILPNVGIDTYAIVTTHRVVLIKLKKESSGVLTPSFCWEVGLGGESMVSSRVSDHGHNGVALTITITKRSDTDETTVTFADEILASPPVDDEATEDSHQDLHSRDLGILGFRDTGEEYDHGVKRGREGELLEWFTVLAEYQYRRQLARLSNAISCVVGDFEAIIYDPSLGHPGNREGYTSFGMFNFEPKLQEDMAASIQSSLLYSLERLHWASFASLVNHTEFGRRWNFAEQLKASKAEGGPDWLINARAKALLVTEAAPSSATSMLLQDFDREALVRQSKRSHLMKSSLSAITDYGGEDMSEASDDRDAEVVVPPGQEDCESAVQEPLASKSLASRDDTPASPMSLADTHKSNVTTFYSTRSNESLWSSSEHLIPRSPLLKLSSALRSKSEHTLRNPSILKSKRDSVSRAASVMMETPPPLVAPESTDTPAVSMLSAAPTIASQPANAATSVVTAQQPLPPESDRLGRMEHLIEQLLVFSSEQAVNSLPIVQQQRQEQQRQQHASAAAAAVPSSNSETQELRREIDGLRHQLQNQEHDEISELRREIASLREQLVPEQVAASTSDMDEFQDATNELDRMD